MPTTPAAATAAFARRIKSGAFVAGAGEGALAAAVVAAGGLLAARLFGIYLPPRPEWAVLLAAPLLVGVMRMRRERVPAALVAQHLDRRLGLHGLFVSAHDGVQLEPAWQQQLARRLTELPQVLPMVQWRRLLLRPCLALLLAAAVAAWPPAAALGGGVSTTAGQAAVARLSEALQRLQESGQLPPEVQQELEQQLQRLQHDLAAGDPDAWRAADELAQRLEREQQLAAASGANETGGAKAGLDTGALLQAAKLLQAMGGLDAIPAELRDKLQQAMAGMQNGGDFDPAAFGLDAAQLQQLAKSLAGAAEQFLQRGGASKQQLADLQQMLQRMQGADGDGKHVVLRDGQGQGKPGGQGNEPGAGEGSGPDGRSGDGQGGVGRGPGFAALNLTEDAQGLADGAFVLPPGTAIPDQWVPISERMTAPDAAPRSNQAPGGAAASGRGGASWQLQLAPRHRAVVQRFFQPGGSAGDGKPK